MTKSIKLSNVRSFNETLIHTDKNDTYCRFYADAPDSETFTVDWGNEMMPPYSEYTGLTFDEAVKMVRQFEPDLRKWHYHTW